jgi:hypothetical protein
MPKCFILDADDVRREIVRPTKTARQTENISFTNPKPMQKFAFHAFFIIGRFFATDHPRF